MLYNIIRLQCSIDLFIRNTEKWSMSLVELLLSILWLLIVNIKADYNHDITITRNQVHHCEV